MTGCQKDSHQKPNIIVILADDLGYSDLGCTGAEIRTPNLDRLAGQGLLFTHCYNTSRCCPSRASLLTGLYQYRTGVGHMNHDFGMPAYQGYLNDRCVTIAEVLKANGYHTMMAGKWHIGDEREHWPDQRGFERFYGVPSGGGLYFYPPEFIDRPVYRNGKQVHPDPDTFYSTDNFTDEAIGFIRETKSDGKPFFLYLPYIAPHFPLQAWQHGRLVREPVHINDIMPTCLELAGAPYPEQFKGNKIQPVDGQSFAGLFKAAGQEDPGTALYWEHGGNKAIRKGDWKLVKKYREPWELYDLGDDPTELNDLAGQKPGLMDSLEANWHDWAVHAGVAPWPARENANTKTKIK